MESRRPRPSYIALCVAAAWDNTIGTASDLLDEASRVLGVTGRPNWLRRMCKHFAARWNDPDRRPTRRDIVKTLLGSDSFLKANDAVPSPDRGGRPPYWTQVLPVWHWNLPDLPTTGALADWLEVSLPELQWFADVRGLNPRWPNPQQWHYFYKWTPKKSGGRRLVSAPKSRLKKLQRRVLSRILSRIPGHPAAHAYSNGRSMTTCLAPHVKQDVVLHLDLADFFPSIQAPLVRATFWNVGYTPAVANLLTGLCAEIIPEPVLDGNHLREEEAARLRTRHLPQGAPTSPALSNLCAFRLDCRLHGLAEKCGANYTRYADDLIFSGDDRFRRRLYDFKTFVGAILLDERFTLRGRKTHILPASRSQQVGGLLVNQRLNVPRQDYDELRATLHNCARFGPAAQNRRDHPHFRQHLLGRIAYVASTNTNRGEKLMSLFAAIDWERCRPEQAQRSSGTSEAN